MSRNTQLGVLACLGVTILAGCCGVALLSAGGALFFITRRSTPSFSFTPIPEFFDTPTPAIAPTIVRTPIPTPVPGAEDTLTALQSADIRVSDLRELAQELRGLPNIPETVSAQPADHPLETELEFNVSNDDTNSNFTVQARLIYKTDNAYFFAESDLAIDEAEVQQLMDEFQTRAYATNREFFGSEWTPGVDGDPRLYILYTRGLGFSIAGYYSSADEYSRLAHPHSNEKEMFYINADNTPLDDPYVASTLAHEFQHMIHWNQDRNEETWLNEGASVLAESLNDYAVGSVDDAFISDPDLQLNAWSDSGSNIAHYGGAFLFLTYFLDRFGETATQELISQPANGMQSVDNKLAELGVTDPATGQPIKAVDVFADWAVTNYLADANVADGRYAYKRYTDIPTASANEAFYTCPVEAQTSTVRQFAADYYEIKCNGQVTLSFTGSQQVQVAPATPHSGRYVVWGHRNDESVTSLTRAFDFTSLTTASLTFWSWRAIEADYDYGYVEVSTDGGQTWQTQRGTTTTQANPQGNNFGWGYTGNSGFGGEPEWNEETVDLSDYAGQAVLIRLQYITDTALTRPGWLIDDIGLPELDYATDFEEDDGGWEAEGFVRMDNLLPQTFVVQIIRQGADTTVERLPLDANNQGEVTLNLDFDDSATVVISGVTPFTLEAASYQFEIK